MIKSPKDERSLSPQTSNEKKLHWVPEQINEKAWNFADLGVDSRMTKHPHEIVKSLTTQTEKNTYYLIGFWYIQILKKRLTRQGRWSVYYPDSQCLCQGKNKRKVHVDLNTNKSLSHENNEKLWKKGLKKQTQSRSMFNLRANLTGGQRLKSETDL